MTLSLCMIVRDEAEQIGECLRSIRALVDETIVVDTGSTDGTVALALEQGARLVSVRWAGDFAAARNRSLAEATGEWVLVLDADERLFPRHFEAVRRLMAKPGAQAIQAFIRTYTDDSNLMNWQPADPAQAESRGFCGYYDSPQVRLFRRRDQARFRGMVHESVAPALERAGIPVYRADLLIHHYKEARTPARKEARNRLILDLARRRTEREADNPEVWRQRAMDAFDVGEPEESVSSLERAIQLAPDRRELYFQLGMILIRCGQAGQACELYRKALERFPDEPELVQSLGEALLADGRVDDAAEEFARSLELDAYLYRALIGLGTIAIRQERSEAARDCLERAKSIHPGLDLPYVNLGLFYLRAGRLDDALGELRRAFGLNPKRWQTLAGIGAILFEMRSYKEAREWYEKAVAVDGCSPEVFVKLCASCAALDLREEARGWAARAAAANPDYASLGARL